MPGDGNDFRLQALGSLDLLRSQREAQKLKDAAGSRLKPLKPGDPSAAPDASKKEIESAATQFEALLLHQMLQSMWNTVPKDGMLSGSHEEEMFRDMLHEAVAKDISEKQSIGIKDVLIRDMERLEHREQRRNEGNGQEEL